MNVIIVNRMTGEPLAITPSVSITPGSGVVMPGRGPMFIPAWNSADAYLRPVVVVRLSRLGKNIESRFASRYYDAVAAGMLLRPSPKESIPVELAAAADNAMALGTWIPMQPGQSLTLTVENPKTSLTFAPEELGIDAAITTLSRYMTLRMGDLLVPILPQIQMEATPETMMRIALNDTISLEVKIK